MANQNKAVSEHRCSPGEVGVQKGGLHLAPEIFFHDYKTTIPIWQVFGLSQSLIPFAASRRWHWATVLGPVEGKRTHTACWPSLLNLYEVCMPYGHISQAWGSKQSISLFLLNLQQCNDPKPVFPPPV